MKQRNLKSNRFRFKTLLFILVIVMAVKVNAQVTLEEEVKITDMVMYFDGSRVPTSTTTNATTGYDYVYGPALTPHGDCLKAYGDFVFMTWYRGGKQDRHVMLSRYNKTTGVLKTIEFPHQHTGFKGRWWIGETHNTIAIGICPKDETIHMVYDMHRNGTIPSIAENDFLRYSYSEANAATVPDDAFTIDLFVQSPNNNYKHLEFPGINDERTTKLLTYPEFMTNDQGDLFMKNRFGFDRNSRLLFAKYDGNAWEGYTDFNRENAASHGNAYNWGIYGDIKYLNGKIRIGFHQRANIRDDRYLYQNGFYYAYSDDPNGLTQWKDHRGTEFVTPLVNSDLVKVSEPGDVVETTQVDKVNFNGFGWTVTDNDDVHLVGKVQDRENNITKFVHTYKPGGATEFITTTDFAGGSIYAAGNDVYLIGLNASGRPVIRRAEGGTNLFVKVYEQTSGKRFHKGQLYIYEGKLYYYLLENNALNNDDTRTTYLQIIDLNIPTGPKPFAVVLNTPSEGQAFQEDETITLFASATADVGVITKVEFLINDVVVHEDTAKPYVFEWEPEGIGAYALKAVAYKTGGNSVTSLETTIEVAEVDPTDLTGDIYRLKNVATGDYLTSNGTVLEARASGEGSDKEWRFVKHGGEGNYYNIDSQTNQGILRFVASAPDGQMINTGFSAPRADGDKIWTVRYNEEEDDYTFEARDLGRYLYQNEADAIVHSDATDTRSKWITESTSQTLSTTDQNLEIAGITVYPNPTNGDFTLEFGKLKNVKIEIYSILGKKVYENETQTSNLNIENNQRFTSGIYLIKAVADGNTTYHTKLVIK